MDTPTYLHSENPRVPRAEVPFRHSLQVQTRFSDIDLLGHVNNNVYLSFMDLAKIDYFTAIMQRPLTPADLRMVVVHIDCDFYEPSYFHEQLTVWTTVQHVGQRSITLQQRITDRSGLSTKCIGTTVMAGFDPATAQGAPVDPQLIAAAGAYEKRDL